MRAQWHPVHCRVPGRRALAIASKRMLFCAAVAGSKIFICQTSDELLLLSAHAFQILSTEMALPMGVSHLSQRLDALLGLRPRRRVICGWPQRRPPVPKPLLLVPAVESPDGRRGSGSRHAFLSRLTPHPGRLRFPFPTAAACAAPGAATAAAGAAAGCSQTEYSLRAASHQ